MASLTGHFGAGERPPDSTDPPFGSDGTFRTPPKGGVSGLSGVRRDLGPDISGQKSGLCGLSGVSQKAAQNSAAVRKFSGRQMSEEKADRELTAAIDLLRTNLADERWRNAVDIEAAADALELSVQTLARARHTLRVETRQWTGCPTQWRLPSQDAVG